MTTTKITPQQLLTNLNNGEVKYRFLTNDIEGFCAWTHEPILRTEYQLDDFLGSEYMSLYEYLKENNLEVVDLGMYEIFEIEPLVKITPKELLTRLSKEDGINLSYLTKDDFGHNSFTSLPLLHDSNTVGLSFYDNISDEEVAKWNVDEYLEVHGLELEEMKMYEIFELKPLVKITPKDILDLMNKEIREINLENGDDEDEGLVRFVTCDNHGIYCYDAQPYFDYSMDVMSFKPEFLCEGLEFNSSGYEIVGLSLNQMFADYSI